MDGAVGVGEDLADLGDAIGSLDGRGIVNKHNIPRFSVRIFFQPFSVRLECETGSTMFSPVPHETPVFPVDFQQQHN